VTQGGPLSYSCGLAGPALLGRTIDEVLSESATRFPQGEALVVCHQGVRLTYAEFQSRVSQTAKGLMALGVRKGDRVGIWAFNCEEWVLTQFATAAIGAILVNINPCLRNSGTGLCAKAIRHAYPSVSVALQALELPCNA
jgi:fatty-acyl-CoA synthase